MASHTGLKPGVNENDEPDYGRQSLRVAAKGSLTLLEEAPGDADTHVSGSQEQWIAALCPGGSYNSLSITGNRELA